MHSLTAQDTEALRNTHWDEQSSQRNKPLGVCLFKVAIGTHISALPPQHSEYGQRSRSARHAVRLRSWPSPRPCTSTADALPGKDSGRPFLSGSSQLASLAFLLGVDEWLSVVSTSGVGMLELGSLFSSFPTKSLASPIPPLQVMVAGAQLQDFTLSPFQHTMTVKSASSLHMQSEENIHTQVS